jgi:hypothetical protein
LINGLSRSLVQAAVQAETLYKNKHGIQQTHNNQSNQNAESQANPADVPDDAASILASLSDFAPPAAQESKPANPDHSAAPPSVIIPLDRSHSTGLLNSSSASSPATNSRTGLSFGFISTPLPISSPVGVVASPEAKARAEAAVARALELSKNDSSSITGVRKKLRTSDGSPVNVNEEDKEGKNSSGSVTPPENLKCEEIQLLFHLIVH